MTTGSNNLVLIDTNILVYESIDNSPFHQRAKDAIQAQEQAGMELWVSRQILREFMATLTRAQIFGGAIAISRVVAEIQFFESRFGVAEDNANVTQRLLTLSQQVQVGGAQIHDANIVATMLSYNISQLLTHNVSDFARFAHLITIIPL